MLVLTVRNNDQIIIDGRLVMEISRLRGEARVSFDAPRDVRIVRGKIATADQWPIGHPKREEASDAA